MPFVLGRLVPPFCAPLACSGFKFHSFQGWCFGLWGAFCSSSSHPRASFPFRKKEGPGMAEGEEKRRGAVLGFHGNSLPHAAAACRLESSGGW